MTEEQELQMLKNQAQMLSQQLEGIQNRITELEKAEEAS
jgi:prefoldin subunit 5